MRWTSPGSRRRARQEDPRLFERVFGDRDVAGTDDDLLALIGGRRRRATCLRCYVGCGTEDALLDDNRRFVAACERRGVDVRRDIGPGVHDWAYWDARIQDVLAWLPIRRP